MNLERHVLNRCRGHTQSEGVRRQTACPGIHVRGAQSLSPDIQPAPCLGVRRDLSIEAHVDILPDRGTTVVPTGEKHCECSISHVCMAHPGRMAGS